MNRSFATITAFLSLLLLVPGEAAAEHRAYDPGDMAFQFRIGGYFPRGDSDFWLDTEQTFTLDHSDFNEAIVGISFVGSFGNHLEAAFNADFYDATVVSAVRGFVDEDGFPIFHDSTLRLTPLTVDVRFLPAGRYRVRSGGRYVKQPVFYIGGGGGLALWEYEEVGDFVDFSDDSIFFDRFKDDGVAFEAHALAGVELPLGRTWSLLFEGRYSWVDDNLGRDFAGLGEIDLGGLSTYLGGSWRF